MSRASAGGAEGKLQWPLLAGKAADIEQARMLTRERSIMRDQRRDLQVEMRAKHMQATLTNIILYEQVMSHVLPAAARLTAEIEAAREVVPPPPEEPPFSEPDLDVPDDLDDPS